MPVTACSWPIRSQPAGLRLCQAELRRDGVHRGLHQLWLADSAPILCSPGLPGIRCPPRFSRFHSPPKRPGACGPPDLGLLFGSAWVKLACVRWLWTRSSLAIEEPYMTGSTTACSETRACGQHPTAAQSCSGGTLGSAGWHHSGWLCFLALCRKFRALGSFAVSKKFHKAGEYLARLVCQFSRPSRSDESSCLPRVDGLYIRRSLIRVRL